MTRIPITDCHAHIIDAARFPYAVGEGYFPGDAEQGDAAAYVDVLDSNGVGRGVLVQPSAYGTDNRAMLDAIARANGRLRGVAVLEAAARLDEMLSLARQGVVGLRLNLGSYDAAFLNRPEADAFLDRATEAGLFVEVYAIGDAWVDAAPRLSRPGLRFIIDHFSHPDWRRPLDQRGFRAAMSLADLPGALLKLSSTFRVSGTPWPHAEADMFVHAAIKAFGIDRCIWGSDWPFIAHTGPVHYAQQLALMERWLPDPTERDRVLRSTPNRLFFEPGVR